MGYYYIFLIVKFYVRKSWNIIFNMFKEKNELRIL